MEKTDKRYQAYIDILREELIPAMGCTEPIAVACRRCCPQYAGRAAGQSAGGSQRQHDQKRQVGHRAQHG